MYYPFWKKKKNYYLGFFCIWALLLPRPLLKELSFNSVNLFPLKIEKIKLYYMQKMLLGLESNHSSFQNYLPLAVWLIVLWFEVVLCSKWFYWRHFSTLTVLLTIKCKCSWFHGTLGEDNDREHWILFNFWECRSSWYSDFL